MARLRALAQMAKITPPLHKDRLVSLPEKEFNDSLDTLMANQRLDYARDGSRSFRFGGIKFIEDFGHDKNPMILMVERMENDRTETA